MFLWSQTTGQNRTNAFDLNPIHQKTAAKGHRSFCIKAGAHTPLAKLDGSPKGLANQEAI